MLSYVRLSHLTWVICTGMACSPALASTNDEAAQLPSITVSAAPSPVSQAAYGTTHISSPDIRTQASDEVESLWRHVPGMHVNHYQLSGVANSVVLRGFGAGGHGGDIAATLDGVSLNEAMSHADGYFDLNLIVPLELEEVTVHHGPTSVAQGNFNRAGLIELRTRQTGEYQEMRLAAGSHASMDVQGGMGKLINEQTRVYLALQHARTDGERPDSRQHRSTLSGRWHHQIRPDLEVALSGRTHYANGQSPGYLGFEAWQADANGKDSRVQGDGATKHHHSLRLDLTQSWAHIAQLNAHIHGAQQDFVRWFTRPRQSSWSQREERYQRHTQGIGVTAHGIAPDRESLKWRAGASASRESTDYVYWEGLDKRKRTQPASLQRNATLDNIAAYGQADWALHPLFHPHLGLRWDQFKGSCRKLGSEQGDTPCSRLHAQSHLSPKLGLAAHVSPQLTLRSSWSEGFALASDFAKYSLGAAELEPNVFRQTEIGAHYTPHPSLSIDASAYRMTSSQEIRGDGLGNYENHGQTLRSGLEFKATWMPHQDWQIQWAHGRARSQVQRHTDVTLRGKQVSGVPAYTSSLHTQWQATPTLTLQANMRHVARMAINAHNTVWSQAYTTLDLGLEQTLPTTWQLGRGVLTAHISNLTNKRYTSTQALIGNQLLVAPGPARTLTLGLRFAL